MTYNKESKNGRIKNILAKSLNFLEIEKWGEGTNILILGDSREIIKELHFLGIKTNLIYMDPPFGTGQEFLSKIHKRGYNDKWDKGLQSYLDMLITPLKASFNILNDNGSILVHLDWHAVHYVKVIMDKIFGYENFINEIIWHYYNKFSKGKKALPRAHDNILWYSKTKEYTFNEVREERDKPKKQLKRVWIDGKLVNYRNDYGKLEYQEVWDKKIDDVWRIPQLQPASKEWTGFPTQKHHLLLEMLVMMASNQEDIVLDPFCGSGTTLISSQRHGRQWIGIDYSKYSIGITRARLSSIDVPNFTLYTYKNYNFHPKEDVNKESIKFKKNQSNGLVIVEIILSTNILGWAIGHKIKNSFLSVWSSFDIKKSPFKTVSPPMNSNDVKIARVYLEDGTFLDYDI